MHSSYYQAKAKRSTIWFVMGCVRNEENVAFHRTFDVKNNILEFFVAPDYEQTFVKLLTFLKKNDYLLSFEKMNNRLIK